MVSVVEARTAGDFARLHDLFVEYEDHLPAVLRHGSVPTVAELQTIYSGGDIAFLALDAERAVGCFAVRELDATTAVMMRLFVKPSDRGLGAARALVTAALNFVRERGYPRVVLDTDKERLAPAYNLYRSFGFEECEPYREVTYPSPTFMERLLR